MAESPSYTSAAAAFHVPCCLTFWSLLASVVCIAISTGITVELVSLAKPNIQEDERWLGLCLLRAHDLVCC